MNNGNLFHFKQESEAFQKAGQLRDFSIPQSELLGSQSEGPLTQAVTGGCLIP